MSEIVTAFALWHASAATPSDAATCRMVDAMSVVGVSIEVSCMWYIQSVYMISKKSR